MRNKPRRSPPCLLCVARGRLRQPGAGWRARRPLRTDPRL